MTGTLDVPNCWSGGFDLKPDFFAAVPSSSGTLGTSEATSANALQLRIQNGGDYESFSDGLAILVDDVGEVAARVDGGTAASEPAEHEPRGLARDGGRAGVDRRRQPRVSTRRFTWKSRAGRRTSRFTRWMR